MKTTVQGQAAEAAVAKELQKQGYEIIGQNWRTRVCEIDIIAKKDNVVYFVEVKYRRQDAQGGGLDYITPKKLKQLHFAAEVWNQQNDWNNDYRLLAAAVSTNGQEYLIEDIIEL